MQTTFEVVAEPARRELMDLLIEGPRSVGELVAATGQRPSTLTRFSSSLIASAPICALNFE